MSDLRIQSSALMSIDPSMVDDPANAVSRDQRPGATGARGTSSGPEPTGSGGAGGVAPSEARSDCFDEILVAAGSCGVTVLSAGAAALVAGVVCVGSTLGAIECLQREAQSPR